LSVLSPSSTQISRWRTVITPSGPEVLLLPVLPVKRPCPALNMIVLVFVLTTWTALPVRSPRR
jgi:hypothetical protein